MVGRELPVSPALWNQPEQHGEGRQVSLGGTQGLMLMFSHLETLPSPHLALVAHTWLRFPHSQGRTALSLGFQSLNVFPQASARLSPKTTGRQSTAGFLLTEEMKVASAAGEVQLQSLHGALVWKSCCCFGKTWNCLSKEQVLQNLGPFTQVPPVRESCQPASQGHSCFQALCCKLANPTFPAMFIIRLCSDCFWNAVSGNVSPPPSGLHLLGRPFALFLTA